jgi:hypothetical protein
MNWTWGEWLDKAAPDLIVALGVGVIAVTAGSALTLFWNIRQKQRELDLETARDFHNHYGAFFSTWKSWNWYLKQRKPDPAIQRELFERAASAEGGVESILSRLAAHRRLSAQMVADLACFRQGFQTLRQAIREDKPLDWGSSEVAEYRRFKDLSGRVSEIIHSRPWVLPGFARPRETVWREITANKWEAVWKQPLPTFGGRRSAQP